MEADEDVGVKKIMDPMREEFREFLHRLSNNNIRQDDWQRYVVAHYADEELESLRRELVRQSLNFDGGSIGWMSRGLQDAARALLEYFREYAEDSIAYCTEWFSFDESGTLTIRATWSDAESHSSGRCEIPPDHKDYAFWKWVVSCPQRRKGRKRISEINSLKDEFLRNGISE